MENIDWLLLKVLYKEKNITKTAEALYISQPAITKRLQNIEKEFDTQIVYRRSKGVFFTAQGEYLAQCADDMLMKLQEIQDKISNMDDTISGTLRIGASYFITRYKLPEILSGFKNQYPKVKFMVSTGWSSDILDMLYSGDIHVAFVRGDYNWQGGKHLLLEETICVTSAKKIQLKDLPQLPRIDYKADHKLKELINSWWMENYSKPPLVCMEVDKSDTCKEMVLKNLGYAIMPSLVLDGDENLYKINILNKEGKPIKRKMWMFYQKESLDLKLVNFFVRFVEELNFDRSV